MSIFGRIIVTILALLSIILITLCISLPWFQNHLVPILKVVQGNIMLQILTIGIGVVFIILNFILIVKVWNRGKSYHISCHTTNGRVQISLGVIKEVAGRIGSKINGVRYLNVQVENYREEEVTVVLYLKVVVDGESSIKDLTIELQREVKLQVEKICGVLVKEIIVNVVRADNRQRNI